MPPRLKTTKLCKQIAKPVGAMSSGISSMLSRYRTAKGRTTIACTWPGDSDSVVRVLPAHQDSSPLPLATAEVSRNLAEFRNSAERGILEAEFLCFTEYLGPARSALAFRTN